MPGSFTDDPPQAPRRGNRTRKVPERYGFRANAATIVIPDEPVTYRQATSGDDADLWQAAMGDEIQSLKENGTWEEVDPPVRRRIVDSKWVFKIKQKADGSIERYKPV